MECERPNRGDESNFAVCSSLCFISHVSYGLKQRTLGMECKRCGEDGAERREVQFQNGSALTVYLCQEYTEAERRRDSVCSVDTSPGQGKG